MLHFFYSLKRMRDNQVRNQKHGQRVSDRNVNKREIVDGGMHSHNLNPLRGYRGDTMTIVFHAVLSPHFKFDQSEGDKIFMRFGGTMFEDFKKDVVEVLPEQ